MKIADLVKLRWLVKCLDNLNDEEYDKVSRVLDKSHRDPHELDRRDLELIDNVYLKTRQNYNRYLN